MPNPWRKIPKSTDTGHINVHETGAIEHTGHKVLALPSAQGKITARQVADAVEAHRRDDSFEHIVQPGMVYISFPTEVGTLYSRQALRIQEAIRQAGYPFFMESSTNQQFPIFPDDVLEKLKQEFLFTFWEKTDVRHTAVRICTSWATTEKNTDRLIAAILATQ